MSEWQHRLVLAAKRWVFAGRGEPYRIGGVTLRFVPGTRPVRLHFQTSSNAVNRYDALQLAWMQDNLAEGDLAIDVGANCGQCTVVMAQQCGSSGSVIAFEPNPYANAVLKRNFDLNPSVKRAVIESFACSDVACGEVDLYHNGNASNSALVPSYGGKQANGKPESFRVPVTTLDSYLAQRGSLQPRFVKIDTEGAEIRVLQGARNVLAGKAAILCELHPYAWPQFGNSLQELKDLLAGYNRRMRYLDQESEVGNEATYGIAVLERINMAAQS
jgi:FkbM family methyltransferase